MRKVLLVLALLAAASVPAMAQRGRAQPTQPTPEELQKQRESAETDAKYNDALKRIKPGEAPARQDPWANIRAPGPDAPKR
jgi:hypothetical protein